MQKFVGYVPDADASAPGIITDCEMMEPSSRGMRSAPSAAVATLPALSSTCKGSALVTRLDGSKRLLAGTQTGLFEAGPSTWADVSAKTYTVPDSRWEFRQFGNVTLAVNGFDRMQASDSGVFADLAGGPVASLIETVAGFVVVANLADAAYPHADGWWSSALYDHTNWTPAIATQSARGRLLDTPGAITALRSIGGNLVAFKARSMYLGAYVGPDVIWAWQQIPGDLGAPSNGSVVSDGVALYWWGGDNFYRFDGSRPEPIGDGVKGWFAGKAAQQYLYKMLGDYDRDRGLVRWYFVGAGDSTPRKCIVYSPRTGQWGRADRAVEATVDYVSSGITYNDPGLLTGVFYDSTAWPQSFDSPFWLASSESSAIVDDTHTLRTLTGVSTASSITTGDIGDDDVYTLLRRVRPRYSKSPATAQMTNQHKPGAGDALLNGDTSQADDGKFDVLQSARWHRLRFDWTGDVETSGFNADMAPEGER